jgi:hypothetical protein
MIQLIMHLFGDYCTQSDWMAQNKTKASWPAFCHAVVYSLPFAWLAWSAPNAVVAFTVILVTHFFIDRFRLARYLVWAKNLLSPKETWWCDFGPTPHIELGGNGRCLSCELVRTPPWKACMATGYPPDRPAWLAVWLLIAADNTIHLAINYAALRWL